MQNHLLANIYKRTADLNIIMTENEDDWDIGNMIKSSYDPDFDPVKIKRANRLQKRMIEEHQRLCDKIDDGKVKEEEAIHRINKNMGKYFDYIGQVIGAEAYQAIFDCQIGTVIYPVVPTFPDDFDFTDFDYDEFLKNLD